MHKPLGSLINKLRDPALPRLPEYVWKELGPGHNHLRPAIADKIEQRIGQMQRNDAQQEARQPKVVTDGELADLMTDQKNAQIRTQSLKEQNTTIQQMVRRAIRDVKQMAKRAATESAADATPSQAELAEFASYHADRLACKDLHQVLPVQLPKTDGNDWDVRADSLARRQRIEQLIKDGVIERPLDGAAIVAQLIAMDEIPPVDLSGQRGAARASLLDSHARGDGNAIGDDQSKATSSMAEKVGRSPRITRERTCYRPPLSRR